MPSALPTVRRRARLGVLAAAVLTAALLAAPAANATPAPAANLSETPEPSSQLNVLTFNIWHGGSQIDDGIANIAEIITQADADVTFLSEKGDAPQAVAALLGYEYFAATDVGIVSRYPIVDTGTVGSWWSKAVLDVGGTEVVVYGGHLEYRWYTTYLPRGYGGAVYGDWPTGWDTWDKIDAPVTDVDAILEANLQSGRPAAAAELVADLERERAAGRLAVVGGDFNEPSTQDWTAQTADLFDHNGVILPWQTTQTLIDAGLIDTYRAVYPDPVANPGFTWPSDNSLFPTSSLTWAPEADERDRIDYVFATDDRRLSIDSATVVGPQSTIVRDVRVPDDSADEIFVPSAVWPTDHKAVLARLTVCATTCTPPTVTVSDETVTAGTTATVTGVGFAAHTPVRLELRSDPVDLGTVISDADGAFTAEVLIPATTDAGAHSFVAIDPVGTETLVAVTVVAAPVIPEAPGVGTGSTPGTDSGTGTGSTAGSDTDPGTGAVADERASTSQAGALAATGADSTAPALIAMALLLTGLGVWAVRRAVHHRSSHGGERGSR